MKNGGGKMILFFGAINIHTLSNKDRNKNCFIKCDDNQQKTTYTNLSSNYVIALPKL